LLEIYLSGKLNELRQELFDVYATSVLTYDSEEFIKCIVNSLKVVETTLAEHSKKKQTSLTTALTGC